MSQQTSFLDIRNATIRVEVLKVYDRAYARECFEQMADEARAFLAKSMDMENKYERTEPAYGSEGSQDDLTWEDVEDEAREDGNLLSFFVVIGESNGHSAPLFVSPDWPSAEAFANQLLARV